MRVDKVSFAGSNGVNSNSVINTGGHSPVLNYADDSFESASKAVKHNSGIKKFFTKAMMGLGVVGLGLGAQACDPTDIPVDPPVTKTLTETEQLLNSNLKETMGVNIPDGKQFDTTFVHDTYIDGYRGLKAVKSTGDTVYLKETLYDKNKVFAEARDLKAYKGSNGQIQMKAYNAFGDFLGTIGFLKEGNSTIQLADGSRRFKLTPQDLIIIKESASGSTKGIIENLYTAVKNIK